MARSARSFSSDLFTFNWTDLRTSGLVGMDGEDLEIPGVTNVGNLVEVAAYLVEVVSDEADAVSVNGTRVRFTSPKRADLSDRVRARLPERPGRWLSDTEIMESSILERLEDDNLVALTDPVGRDAEGNYIYENWGVYVG